LKHWRHFQKASFEWLAAGGTTGNEALMKHALASDSPRESYVIEIDGIPKFEFRVFSQALSAALHLKHDLPELQGKTSRL
jgi:hypothetical protein